MADATWSFVLQFGVICCYRTNIKACTLNYNFGYQVTEIISEIRAPIVTVAVDPSDARRKELKVSLFYIKEMP
jgi:hypothetical protein